MKTYLVKRNEQWQIENRTHAPHDAEFTTDIPCCPKTKQPRPPYALNIRYKTPEGRPLKAGESLEGAVLVAEYDPDKERQYLERQAALQNGDIKADIRACLPDWQDFVYAYLEEKDGRPERMNALLVKFALDKRKIK